MPKTKKEPQSTDKSTDTSDMLKLVDEIRELVAIRVALGYGTGTGVRKSAESTISRAISAKVDILSKMVVEAIDA